MGKSATIIRLHMTLYHSMSDCEPQVKSDRRRTSIVVFIPHDFASIAQRRPNITTSLYDRTWSRDPICP